MDASREELDEEGALVRKIFWGIADDEVHGQGRFDLPFRQQLAKYFEGRRANWASQKYW